MKCKNLKIAMSVWETMIRMSDGSELSQAIEGQEKKNNKGQQLDRKVPNKKIKYYDIN